MLRTTSNPTRPTSTIVTLAAAFAASLTLICGVASAAHSSYCYEGECLGFDGEQHVIESLELMDRAALAECERARVNATLAAKREVTCAIAAFCSAPAKEDLLNGLRALNRFLAWDRPCDLDEAARAVTRSLAHERRAHKALRPSVPPEVLFPPVVETPVAVVPASYCFTGECLGFAGEREAIRSLKWMDAALAADCPRERLEAVNRSQAWAIRARGEFCHFPARRELTLAARALDQFAATGRPCALDEAAASVNRALDLERAVQVVERPHFGRQTHRHLTMRGARVRIGFSF